MPRIEINKELLNFITANRDAVATNRGFYYQYLSVLSKWLTNFINGVERDTYTEVDEDIKEIGNQIIFTQIKCYSSVFSFKSTEIKKAILNFFTLYLQNQNNSDQLSFFFSTNSDVAKNESLLQKWISEGSEMTKDTFEECIKTVSTILFDEVNNKVNKLLDKKDLSEDKKIYLETNLSQFKVLVYNTQLVGDFVKKINWNFEKVQPEEAVERKTSEILSILENPLFEKRPKKLLLDVLLSEIYRVSQLTDPAQRKVTNSSLKVLLVSKDEELTSFINPRFIQLFHTRIDTLEKDVKNMKQDIGDLTIIQKEHEERLNKISIPKIIPHLLTVIPYFDASLFVGRNEMIEELSSLLKDHKHISVNGNGGMGKSTIIKKYLSDHSEDYDHIIWLNVEIGLVSSISLSEKLAENIDFPISDKEDFSQRFSLIVNRLNQIAGNNLLVLDSYDTIESELSELQSLQNWKIIIGTRLRLTGWKVLTAKELSFEEAKSVYTKIDNENIVSDAQLNALFKHVEYNTLVISLIAKTIRYSFDLTLEVVLEHFDDRSLDDEALEIDLPDDSGESLNLLKIINKTFSLSKIDNQSAYYLSFLAILPLEDTNFSDLIDWFGEESQTANKKELTNAINNLHSKGLIERIGRQITIHKVLRDSIIYQERLEQNPFLSQLFNITALTYVLKKGSDYNLSNALRFLKFGEAFLDVIKEPYRKSVYQPLLMLENEVLHIYNWLRKDNLSGQWADLLQRAENYLSEKDPLLGLISNNYGLVLAAEGNMEQAFHYFEKAVSILSLYKQILPKLFISICNQCQLFIQEKQLDRFKECFDKLQDLRKKHNLYDDVSMPIQTQVLTLANFEANNFPEAIKLYKYAILIHKELAKEDRNDAFLMHYYTKLGESFFFNKEFEDAEKAAVMAFNIFRELNARVMGYPIPIYKLMYSIAVEKNDQPLIEALKKAFDEYNKHM